MGIDATDTWRALAGAASVEPGDAPRGVSGDEWQRFVDTVASPLVALTARLRPAIIGLSGPPGSGKSTLVRLVATASGGDTRVLSLDDFYLSRAERAERGMKWRGPPGSHDLAALVEVLWRVRFARAPIEVPRFSAEIDDRIEPLTLERVPDLVLLDGWFLGYTGDGYDEILQFLDLIVYLDVDTDTSRERRFEREALLREAGGGFSEQDMQRFWDEVLGPGIERWSRAAQASADVVLTLGPHQQLRSVTVRDPSVLTSARIDGP